MDLIKHIIEWTGIAVCSYLLLASGYLFVLSLFGTWYKSNKKKLSLIGHKLAVIVPAYKNDAVLLQSTAHNLSLLKNIEGLDFDYIILGDKLQESTLHQLPNTCTLFEIKLEKSTKSRAINQWLSSNNKSFTHLLVLDVDNLLTKEHIAQGLALALQNNEDWTQFKRIAANENTEISGLDAWSEMVNNHIFRRGASAMGIFPALIGSGMVAPMDSFKNIHGNIDVTGGFDKWVEHYLLQSDTKVQYLDHVWIKDQKIAEIAALKTQRTRWVAAQFLIAKQLFATFIKSLLTLKWKRAAKYYQLYLPPRVLHLAASILMLPLGYFISKLFLNIALANILLLTAALLLATPVKNWLGILRLMFNNGFRLIFNYLGFFKGFKKANKEFIATEHSTDHDSN